MVTYLNGFALDLCICLAWSCFMTPLTHRRFLENFPASHGFLCFVMFDPDSTVGWTSRLKPKTTVWDTPLKLTVRPRKLVSQPPFSGAKCIFSLELFQSSLQQISASRSVCFCCSLGFSRAPTWCTDRRPSRWKHAPTNITQPLLWFM